jgi:hypothetical protein
VPLGDAAKRNTKCSKHPTKELELWCHTDQQLMCLICDSHGGHKGHKSVILDEFKELAQQQLRDNITTIGQVATRVNSAIQAVDDRRSEVIRVTISVHSQLLLHIIRSSTNNRFTPRLILN